ncbi:hypothetical protein FQA47_014299 [Oryzias melastigma]|uniref:Uncharacterized protein n=1 Tax=Oryzias melastigma TaxID=30732 RepID=A0A834KY75_ORYME|nr:hypothetical protein FQA47_014299 [Oryzias melastigma]
MTEATVQDPVSCSITSLTCRVGVGSSLGRPEPPHYPEVVLIIQTEMLPSSSSARALVAMVTPHSSIKAAGDYEAREVLWRKAEDLQDK